MDAAIFGDIENGIANAFSVFVHNETVGVSTGRQLYESHELVMAAVAAMGQSLGPWDDQRVRCARAARQGHPTTRPTSP